MMLLTSRGCNGEKGVMIPPQALANMLALQGDSSDSSVPNQSHSNAIELFNKTGNGKKKGTKDMNINIQEMMNKVLKSDD